MTSRKRTVRWTRIDRPGTDVARLYPFKSTWHIQGKIDEYRLLVFPLVLGQESACSTNATWRT